jgi:hypothetical protein
MRLGWLKKAIETHSAFVPDLQFPGPPLFFAAPPSPLLMPPPPSPTQVCIVVRGIDTIKAIETLSAPILVALAAALLAWALTAAGGLGPMLAAPSQVCDIKCDSLRQSNVRV